MIPNAGPVIAVCRRIVARNVQSNVKRMGLIVGQRYHVIAVGEVVLTLTVSARNIVK